MTHTVETLSRAFVNDFHRKIFFKKKLQLFKRVHDSAEYIPPNDNNVDFILRVKCDFVSYNKFRNTKKKFKKYFCFTILRFINQNKFPMLETLKLSKPKVYLNYIFIYTLLRFQIL